MGGGCGGGEISVSRTIDLSMPNGMGTSCPARLEMRPSPMVGPSFFSVGSRRRPLTHRAVLNFGPIIESDTGTVLLRIIC